ncbi:hypothetical protein FB451DRAFT_1150672 [Mycena latifolia]|nr:hypothetical protein FB451DRAFT_1150672 [Mycena latifolia]
MEETTAPSFVKPPFDDPDADVILRSSDSTDFRLCRAILTRASPFFKDLFCIPQPADAPEMPVIDVAETAAVLDRALSFWYPGAEPRIETLEQLRQTLDLLLLKYDIQFVVPTGKKYLAEYLEQQPIAVFALACHYRWEALARKAAKECLKLRSADLIDNDSTIYLGLVSADIYQSLLMFHKHCGTEAIIAVNDIMSRNDWEWQQCRTCSSSTGSGIRKQWVTNLLAEVEKRLKEQPMGTLSDPLLLTFAAESIANCRGACRGGFPAFFFVFGCILPQEFAERFETVELSLNFKD